MSESERVFLPESAFGTFGTKSTEGLCQKQIVEGLIVAGLLRSSQGQEQEQILPYVRMTE